MSYATRLIADSAPVRRPTVAPTPVVPLEIDVDVLAPRSVTPARPGPPATPEAAGQALPFASRLPTAASPSDAGPDRLNRVRSGPVGGWRAFDDRRSDAPRPEDRAATPAARDADPPGPSALPPVGPSAALPPAMAPVSDPAIRLESTASVESELHRPDSMDPPDQGVPFRRLAGIDSAVPARPADDRPGEVASSEPAAPRLAIPARSDDRGADRPEPVRREPEVERLTLSIGSIEVIVDPPERMAAPAPPLALPPAPASARAVADPIMRLRRQYVTWPDGD
jgi:hypothetical protein